MAGGQGGSSNANANPGGAGGTGYTGDEGTPGSGFGGGGQSSGGSGGGGGAAGGGAGAAGGSGSGANSATPGYAGGKGGTSSHPDGYAGTSSGNNGGFTPSGAGGGGGGFNAFSNATLNNGAGTNLTGGNGGAGGSDYSVGGGGGGGAGGYGAVVTGAAGNANAGGLYGGTGGAGGGAGQGGANGGPGAAGGGGGAGAAFSATDASFNNTGKILGGKGGIGGSGAYGAGEGGGGPGGAGGAGTVFTKATFTLDNGGSVSGGTGGQGGAEGQLGPNGTGGAGGAGVVGTQGTIVNTGQITGGMGGTGGTGTSPYGTTGGNGGAGGDGINGASLTITNTGTIAAGTGGARGAAGSAGAAGNAIDLSGGTSSLTLGNTTKTGTITGAIGVGGSLSIDPGTAAGNNATLANLVHNYSGTVPGSLTKVGAGTLTLSGANTYSGGTTIQAGVLDLASARTLTGQGAFQSAAAGSGAITYAASGTATARLTLETTAQPASGGTFGNTLTNFTAATESLDLRGFSFTGPALYATNASTLTVMGGTNGASSQTFTLSNGALAYTAQSDGAGGTLVTAVCYAGGTRIRILRDDVGADVAVEDLAVGDLAVTSSGAHRAIRWLGSFTVDCAKAADPRRVWPIRIAACAFGPDRPSRDLRVSPDHAICVDVLGEVLVPAFAFLNGATVTQDRVDEVTYWHVELDGGHDVLLAENLPAESYLDCGNRDVFGRGGAADQAIDPSADATGSCRERTNDPVVQSALRARLRRQALALGWRLEEAELGGLRLLVDGTTVLPDADGLAARFLLSADTRDVWLVSSASVPWDVSDAADGRRLGLCLSGLSLGDGLSVQRTYALDDDLFAEGFHPAEAEAHCRWTDGRARLDPELWAGCKGHVFLRIDLARPCLPVWRAPVAVAGAALRAA